MVIKNKTVINGVVMEIEYDFDDLCELYKQGLASINDLREALGLPSLNVTIGVESNAAEMRQRVTLDGENNDFEMEVEDENKGKKIYYKFYEGVCAVRTCHKKGDSDGELVIKNDMFDIALSLCCDHKIIKFQKTNIFTINNFYKCKTKNNAFEMGHRINPEQASEKTIHICDMLACNNLVNLKNRILINYSSDDDNVFNGEEKYICDDCRSVMKFK